MSGNDIFKWPDLSMYGVHLTATISENGKGTLSIVGATGNTGGEINSQLRRLGFRREPAGSWFNPSVEDNQAFFDVMKRTLPEITIMTEGDVCYDGTVMRKNNVIIDRRPAPAVEEVMTSERSTENARLIGKNSEGHDVYKATNGERFIRLYSGGDAHWFNKEKDTPAKYLLAYSPEDIAICTYGLASTIRKTPLRMFEFRNFVRALYDMDSDSEIPEDRMMTVFRSLNNAISRNFINGWKPTYNLSGNQPAGSQMSNFFKDATVVFENNRIPETLADHESQYISPILSTAIARILNPATLPVLEIDEQGNERNGIKGAFYGMDNMLLASSMLSNDTRRDISISVYEPDSERLASLRQGIREAGLTGTIKVYEEPIYVDEPRITMTNIAPEILNYKEEIEGLETTRQDIVSLMDSITTRADNGRTIAIIHTMGNETDEEIESLRKWLVANYEVEGVAQVDSKLVSGYVGGRDTFIFSIGNRRDEVLNYEMAPEEEKAIIHVNDVNNLWTWTSLVLGMRVKFHENGLQRQEEDLNTQDGVEGNKFQMPYSSMSRMRAPTTMTPKNMQGPTVDLQRRILSEIGQPVDEWIVSQLGYNSIEEMSECISPEQVDAIALGIMQFNKSRSEGDGMLIADDMGVGKGRSMISLGAYSLIKEPNGRLIYVTEYASSFSDIVREIKSTRQDGIMNIFMMNSGAQVVDEKTGEVTHSALPTDLTNALTSRSHWPDGSRVRILRLSSQEARRLSDFSQRVLAKPSSYSGDEIKLAQTLKTIQRNRQISLIGEEEELPDYINTDEILDDTSHFPNYNVCLTTYSQFNRPALETQQEGRRRKVRRYDKAQWFVDVSKSTEESKTTLLLDEAHNVASRTSNMSKNAELAVEHANKVAYASATWAKDIKNLFVYKRILPSNMNLDMVSDVLAKGGDAMKETFSIMLIRNGAYIRREIDLSKCEFRNVIDTARYERNVEIVDQIAPVLSSIAVLCGTINERVSLLNNARTIELEKENRERDSAGSVRGDKGLFNATAFGSPLNMLSKLIARSIIMDHTAELAVKALEEGRKPIVQLHSTLERLLLEVKGDSDHVPDIRDVMKRIMERIVRVKNKHGQVLDFSEQIASFDITDEIILKIEEVIPSCITDLSPERMAHIARETAETLQEVEARLEGELSIWMRDNGVTSIGHYMAEKTQDFYKTLIEDDKYSHEDIMKSMKAVSQAMDFQGENETLVKNLQKIRSRVPNNPATEIRRIFKMIEALPPLEINAIDYIKNKITDAGFSCGEITGRSTHVVDNVLVRRDKEPKGVAKDKFNRGEYDALVINDAGSTAIDLHAGSRFVDQRQRELIMCENMDDINRVVQLFGRIYRFDSVNNPIFTRALANLPIELRLQIALNAKMRSLSSISTSNKETARLTEGAPDLINKVGDIVISRYLARNPGLAETLGLPIIEEEADAEEAQTDLDDDPTKSSSATQAKHSVNIVLSRIAMLLLVDEQKAIIRDVENEFRALIDELDATGKNPLKMERLKGRVTPVSHVLISGYEADESVYQNEFSKPTYLMNAKVQVDTDYLPASRVMQMVDTSIGSHVAENTQDRAKIIWDNRRDVLANFLPQHVVDVEEYINEGHGNSVLRGAHARLRNLCEILKKIEIGNHISYQELGMPTEGIIVDFTMPPITTSNASMSSHYDVIIANPGSPRVKSMRLSTLLSSANMMKKKDQAGNEYLDFAYEIDREKGFMGADPERTREWFEAEAKAVSARMKHVKILVGNEWTSRLMLAESPFGKAIEYIDHDGVERRGVQVINSDRFECMPANVETPNLAYRFLDVENKITFRDGEVIISIPTKSRETKEGNFISASLPHVSSKTEMYFSNPVILKILDEIAGDNKDHTKWTEGANFKTRRVIVNINEEQAKVLIQNLFDMGVPCQIEAKKRPVLAEIRAIIEDEERQKNENAKLMAPTETGNEPTQMVA